MRRGYLLGLIVGVVAIAVTAGGLTVSAMSSGGGDASGPEADAAAAAAMQQVGGGALLEVEHGDDEGAVWEVEIRKTNGEEIEVLLDADLNQIAIYPNDDAGEGPDDDDGNESDSDDDSDSEGTRTSR